MGDPSRRVAATMKQLTRNVRELKTPQKIGADILTVVGAPVSGPATANVLIGSNQAKTFTFTITPANQTLTLWNFAHDIYVDTNTAAFQFPNGSSLTPAQASVTVTSWLSWGDSSDTTNVRVYKIRVYNQDVSSHTYYLSVRAYLPSLAVS